MSPVKPGLPSGVRDLLPREALLRQGIIDRIRGVYESFGFVPLETPGMERIEVLTGGSSDFNKSIFVTRIQRGVEDRDEDSADWEQDYGMRFDLTVPLARVVSANPKLPRPFKRYQIGQVWRGEKAQEGRFREFTQFDFDIIGSRSLDADVEAIQVMHAVMLSLGIERFMIKINTRLLLNGLVDKIGCAEKRTGILRILDKVDRLGVAGVVKELQREPRDEFDESAVAIDAEAADTVAKFLALQDSDSTEALLDSLEGFFSSDDTTGLEGLAQLRFIAGRLELLDIDPAHWCFDLSVARGLDYYTGPVFETFLTDLPKLGSVFSGGRFDGLTDRFIVDSNVAGVGASVGISRLLVGLEKLGLVEATSTCTEVLVTIFSEEMRAQSLVLAAELRREGFNVESYLGEDSAMRGQISYAAKQGIPFVTIVGPSEVESGEIQLKNMAKREQTSLTKESLFDTLRAALKGEA